MNENTEIRNFEVKKVERIAVMCHACCFAGGVGLVLGVAGIVLT